MSRVLDAIAWSGSEVMLSMFVVVDAKNAPALDFSTEKVVPIRVRTYELEDDGAVLGGLRAFEYDVSFRKVPIGLEEYLETCLRRAAEGPVRVAWFAFEGSFHFDHLLTDDVADQIYALVGQDGETWVTLEDAQLMSESWRQRVRRYRAALTRGPHG